MAGLLPFGKPADFLNELLPVSAQTAVNTVRNRAMRVGKRLRKSAEVLTGQLAGNSRREAHIGLDGGYVRSRHPRPERNFEAVAGKVLDDDGNTMRFAFVKMGLRSGQYSWSDRVRNVYPKQRRVHPERRRATPQRRDDQHGICGIDRESGHQ
jgi:hypothetical protein